jgi:CDP-diacylglycerol pyrophosphatase
VLQMERLGPIVTESSSLDDGIHLTSSDAHVDENEAIEEYFDEIDQLQKALLSSLIEVSDTEGPSLEETLNSHFVWLSFRLRVMVTFTLLTREL